MPPSSSRERLWLAPNGTAVRSALPGRDPSRTVPCGAEANQPCSVTLRSPRLDRKSATAPNRAALIAILGEDLRHWSRRVLRLGQHGLQVATLGTSGLKRSPRTAPSCRSQALARAQTLASPPLLVRPAFYSRRPSKHLILGMRSPHPYHARSMLCEASYIYLHMQLF